MGRTVNTAACFEAVKKGHLGLLRDLLPEDGGGSEDWNMVDEMDRTLVHYAAERGHVRIVLYLINGGTIPTQKDKDGNTPAHLALRSGREGVVVWLWKKGAKQSILSDKNNHGEIVFDQLSERGKQSLRMYQQSLLPIPKTARAMSVTMDEIGNVHEACRAGDLQTLLQLLDEHADNPKAIQELIETRSLEGKNAVRATWL